MLGAFMSRKRRCIFRWIGYKVEGDMCSERDKMLLVRGERACLWMIRSNKPSERRNHSTKGVQGDFLKTSMRYCFSPA